MTAMAEGGKVQFANVPKSELTAQVVASGYETAKKTFQVLDRLEVKVKVELQPMTDKEAAASDRGIAALTPKAQKNGGKALEALRANRSSEARSYLQAAQRDAPNSAEVEYLFGVYASQMNDMQLARSYWMRALELNPSHLSALLAMSQGLLQEHKAAQAVPYLTRALELGHERAASVQPLLAHALFESGEKERAIKILQEYVAAHPADENSAKLLERLKAPAGASPAASEETDVSGAATTLAVPSNWLPPDVDEKMPPVETGASCALDDVVKKAGEQLVLFVHDVDRFT